MWGGRKEGYNEGREGKRSKNDESGVKRILRSMKSAGRGGIREGLREVHRMSVGGGRRALTGHKWTGDDEKG